jgi:uncharacterized protein YeaO (DUF488 family)
MIRIERVYDPPGPRDGYRILNRPALASRTFRTIALLYGARDKEHNNAVDLKEFLEDLR